MLPPTRTGARWRRGGGGGGGGFEAADDAAGDAADDAAFDAADAFLRRARCPVSALISLGASTGAAAGLTSITGLGAAAALRGRRRRRRGRRRWRRRDERHHRRRRRQHVGRHSGMITTAPMIAVCTRIDSGTVYHCWLPTVIDGSTTSPNISRATECPPRIRRLTRRAGRPYLPRRCLCESPAGRPPIIVSPKTESQRNSPTA